MKHLVIGLGEVGTAIKAVLNADGIDAHDIAPDTLYDVLHICFPYSDKFIDIVRVYEQQFDSKLIIIHSTVPVGTSKKLNAVHSPIRGIHPYLEQSVRVFTKLFGGSRAGEAAEIFSKLGIKTETTPNSDNTEAGKLWCTTGYGLNIILEKHIKDYCDKNNLDFDFVYHTMNKTYNTGYGDMNMFQFQKYDIEHRDGKIGGHCILPNCKLLNNTISDFILKENEKF